MTEKIRKLKEQADKIEKDRDSYIAHFEQINQEITLINIEIKQLKQQIVELQETHGDGIKRKSPPNFVFPDVIRFQTANWVVRLSASARRCAK